MSNNSDITIYDFENICRTCLSKEDLKPLYEKCIPLTCLVDMLMSCTVVKFTEGDGLPMKICAHCINEINQAFSFAKRCEATDTILQNCLKIKTELVYNSSRSEKVEQIIKAEEEIEAEVILPNIHQTVEVVLGDYEFVEVDAETKIEHEEFVEEQVKDVKFEYVEFLEEQEEDVKIEFKDDDPVEDGDNLDDTNSEKSDNPGYTSRRRSTKSQIEEESSEDEDDTPLAKTLDLLKEKGEKPYICSACTKAFATRQNLKSHMRIHTGEKPYICKVCSKAFTQLHHLTGHMRLHTGDKPYTCKVCREAFTRNSNLKDHMRRHTGEKPYTCKVCSKCFRHISNLTVHMRVHTGEKPYTCKVCSKTFTQYATLKYHLRIHTEKKLYTCGVCGKNLSTNKRLTNHKRTHTGEF